MPVQYVKDFSFAPSPPRPTIRGYARGGHVSPDVKVAAKPSFAKGGHWIAGAIKHPGALHRELGVPQGQKIPAKKLESAAGKGGKLGERARLAETLKGMHKKAGGSAKCYADGGRVATGKQWMGEKKSQNPDDAVSPGSPKRTPMSESASNKSAASNKFATTGRGTPPATKQSGDIQRMSGYSDFKKGGAVKHDRLKNLGHYAHGGKVKPTTAEKPSGKAGSGAVKAPVSPARGAAKAESKAGTPKTSPGSRVEMKAGTARAAMGGLSRGTSPKKNAAIHAKSHKPHGAGVGALATALSGQAMPKQGPAAPPGMAGGMGAPPGAPMGAIAPQAPTMGGGPPAMASGGGVKHVVVHHVSHR
jgi:hypothetical protein